MSGTVRHILFAMAAAALLTGLRADAAERPLPPELARVDDLIARGEPEAARKALMEYRRLRPGDPRGLIYEARLTEEVPTAVALYREAARLALPLGATAADSVLAAEAMAAQADLLRLSGDTAGAVGLCERVIAAFYMTPSAAEALYILGTINLTEGKAENAREKFRTYLERYPEGTRRLEAAAGLMESRVLDGDWNNAIEDARRVLEEPDPDGAFTPRVLAVMVRAWRELGNEDNAARFTERLLDTYPDSQEAHDIRAKGEGTAAEVCLSFEDGTAGSAPAAAGTGTGTDGGSGGAPYLKTPAGENSGVARPDAPKTGKAYSVQASSFRDRMNALQLYNSLTRAGFDARVEMKTVGGTLFYAVLVGRWADRDDAEAVIEPVQRAAGGRPFVVIVEQGGA